MLRRRAVTFALLAAAVASIAAGAMRGAADAGHSSPPTPAATSPGGSPIAGSPTTGATPTTGTLQTGAPTASRPNIVFVLTDDLSMDLLRYMPQVQALQGRGLTFDNYFVSDSLCCPSRASIFTGEFPHDTHVFTNSGPNGGIRGFYAHGDEHQTFNLALQRAGYRTAMMGKYLNGYLEGPRRAAFPSTEVPPGWNQWDVAGWGYPEFDYRMDINGTVHHYGRRPQAYLTGVLARKGAAFIDRSANSGHPFFLELATFAPHSPYTPAPRDRGDFPGLTAPEPPNFDVLPTNAPSWLAGHPPLSPNQIDRINRAFRRRAQAVQSVDRMIAAVQAALQRNGLLKNTYVVFSSDNGLHTGEYRLMPGKLTAFDTDIHVPLVIAGPGIPAGATTDAMAENVDLAETFAAIGDTGLDGDGHSLLPLEHGGAPAGWRNAILVEHHGPALNRDDPDAQSPVSGNPPTYSALRTARFLYVEYVDGEREYYDLRTDPDELDNIAPTLPPARLQELHQALTTYEHCHGADACWAAGHVPTDLNAALTGR
ncbi:MAG TPA: sulfatase [Solirubrobacteraceae bacterium]|nr:sulfatase [Solirubrobacteraceae bacterium]